MIMRLRVNRLVYVLVGAALAVPATASANYAPPAAWELDELTIADIQAGMKSGKYTARSLTQKYLQRIADLDKRGPTVNAVIGGTLGTRP